MTIVLFLKKVWDLVRPKTQQDYINDYLSQSTDLADLERRMVKLQRQNYKVYDHRGVYDFYR